MLNIRAKHRSSIRNQAVRSTIDVHRPFHTRNKQSDVRVHGRPTVIAIGDQQIIELRK